MDHFTSILLIVCVISCSYEVIEARRLVQLKNGKIVGGTEADIREYPYMAYLLMYNGTDFFECGGSIISKRHVLTAAHCLEEIESITVRIASTRSDSGGRTYETSLFTYHPRYDPDTYDYDVAIVRVPQGMELDGINATKVALVRRWTVILENTLLNVTGWGTTSEGGTGTGNLMATQVPTVSKEDCQEQLGEGVDVTARMLCAGYDEGGRDSCQGDSGGPAVNNNIQLGIVSSGFGCARPNTPGLYTNIANRSIRTFIRFNARV